MHPNEPLQGDVGYQLWQLQHRQQRLLEHDLAPLRLNLAQFAKLAHLADTPGLSAAELARLLHLTPQAIGLLTTRLEAADYLAREPAASGRSQPLQITSAGKRVLTRARGTVTRTQQTIFAALDASEQEQLRAMLARCLDTTEGNTPQAG
jgi:DNA-binding MarR family transcriptional regulator